MRPIHRWTEPVVRVILGGIFVYAGAIKFADPRAFADSIYSLALLPRWAIDPLAEGLPVFEMALGALLVSGWARRISAPLTAWLYALFIFVLGQALVRGVKIDCGCFGSGRPSFGGMSIALLRDIILWAAALYVLRRVRIYGQNSRFVGERR